MLHRHRRKKLRIKVKIQRTKSPSLRMKRLLRNHTKIEPALARNWNLKFLKERRDRPLHRLLPRNNDQSWQSKCIY